MAEIGSSGGRRNTVTVDLGEQLPKLDALRADLQRGVPLTVTRSMVIRKLIADRYAKTTKQGKRKGRPEQ